MAWINEGADGRHIALSAEDCYELQKFLSVAHAIVDGRYTTARHSPRLAELVSLLRTAPVNGGSR